MKKRKIQIEVEGYLWVCPHDHETFQPYKTKNFIAKNVMKNIRQWIVN